MSEPEPIPGDRPMPARAVAALQELRARLEAIERARTEPIAIIGLGCRFPGADGPEAFWRLLRERGDAIREVPPDRWDVERLYDPDPDVPGKLSTRWGGFLGAVDGFDAGFFAISPREAVRMDPQHRLLLEVTWEALEHAGQPVEALRGTDTGVFVGIQAQSSDYGWMQFADPDRLDAHSGTGTAHNVAAGRLAYALDLRGPCLAVDTACSSSLVAVHLACQSLRSAECDLALAGGVNLMLSPEFTIAASRMRMLAADGRCKTFDARADGFVRSEGCGLVVLKRLSDAGRDGDRVIAVIRGSAVNQDGHTNGLTAPNGLAQQAVIRRALAAAGLPASRISFIEAHGAGTALGDPIEVEALAEVYGRVVGAPPCPLGAVKTNLGHLEAAAGVAALIKVALALERRTIPPNVHFTRLNPHISLAGTRLVVPTEVRPWAAPDGPRAAAVSSFGWSGTNAHAVLEEAPAEVTPPPLSPDAGRAHALAVSARDPGALRALAAAYRDTLMDPQTDAAPALADVCFTAATRRSHHEHRLVAVGRTRDELAAALDGFVRDAPGPGLRSGAARARRRRIVYVFPGQGGQWPGMARQLRREEPVVREALERCDAAFRPYVEWSLLAELDADPARARFDEIDVVQPALFALQVALAELWRARGIEPDAVIGHSMGEVAAAHVAGALELSDAARVICRRSRLLRRLSGQGGMAVVDLPVDEARAAIGGRDALLSIAASNGRRLTVLSGDGAALDAVVADLDRRGIFARRVGVAVAAHSPQVEPLGGELLRLLDGLRPREATVAFHSTVTGERLAGERLDAEYWRRNLREPVLFAPVVGRLARDGYDAWIELSPHPTLIPALEQDLGAGAGEAAPLVLASLRRDADARATLLEAFASLYAHGHPVEWHRVYPRGRRVALPGYPWQRERFWLESRPGPAASRPARSAPAPDRAPVATAPDAVAGCLYSTEWRPRPWPADGRPAAPGPWLVLADAGGVAESLAAAARREGHRCVLAWPGDRVEKTAPDRYRLRPGRRDDLEQVIAAAADGDARPWRGVVHLWSLGIGEGADGTTASALEAARLRGSTAAVHLVQALGSADGTAESRLWLVTRGAHRLADDRHPIALAQTPLWGLGRVVAEEHPELWGGLVDLDPAAAPGEAGRRLWQAAAGADGEDQLAIRAGRRYVLRLTRVGPDVAAAPVRWRTDGTYLLTGGLGALGLQTAGWMVTSGARHLVLLGRAGLPPRETWSGTSGAIAARVAAVRVLEDRGARVRVAAASVADEAELGAALDGVRREGWPPIRGVVHAAGVIEDRLVRDLDADALREVWRPKVLGGWLLDRLLDGDELDCFVSFSSLAALLGQAGQASYAAANAFLDALARDRAGRGRPGLSVGWGGWADLGFAATPGGRRVLDHFARRGIGSFTAAEALAALEAAIAARRPHIAAVPIVWPRLRAAIAASRDVPLLAELLDGPAGPPATPRAAGGWPERLAAAPLGQRRRLLEEHVRDQLGHVLGLEPSRIGRETPLGALGVNSLMGLELRNRLERSLRLRLPATLIWNHPDLAALATYLAERLELALAASDVGSRPEPTTAPVGPPSGDLEELSDEEAIELLRRPHR